MNTTALLSRFTVALAACALPGWASSAVVFSDTFDQGASAAWGNEVGQWRSADGVYDASQPNNSPATYSSVTTLPALTDFIVDVDVNQWNDGGVWLRSNLDVQTGAITGVLLVTGGNGGSYNGMYWHTVVDGHYSGASGHLDVPGLQGSNQHLTITVLGQDYTACVGTACTTLTTGLFGNGHVGLYDFSPTSGATAPRGQTFDNLRITVASSVPEPLTGWLALAGLPVLGWALRRRHDR